MVRVAETRAQVRPYRGVDAAQRLADRRRRFIEAGLDLLGDTSQTPPPELTVRAVCRGAGLAARYFYETFADKDQFVGAVFDAVIAELATTTQAAVAAAPQTDQNRAGMANIVRTVASDPRIGGLLFNAQLSNAVVNAKRAESGVLLATLYGREIGVALKVGGDHTTRKGMATAHFAVGGVGQTISAWLAGDVDLSPDELVDQLAAILDEISQPRLYGGAES
ncbi:TetR/AcrR family transcriptional regulator [Mycolicibacterium sediminis]|nr:TetR/AcrR family transcriptional regulator [Mycolicibacterium sediminis]